MRVDINGNGCAVAAGKKCQRETGGCQTCYLFHVFAPDV